MGKWNHCYGLVLGAVVCCAGVSGSAQESAPLKGRAPVQPPAMRLGTPAGRSYLPPEGHAEHKREETRAAEEGMTRIEHLRVAAENLALAGFEREGAELRERAARLEQALVRNHPEGTHELLVRELRGLREGLNELRHEVQQLRLELRQSATTASQRGLVPPAYRESSEGHIRLPDRGSRIPDELLDAVPQEQPPLTRPRISAEPKPQPSFRQNEVEFELVPVPVDPAAPAPVPNPAPPEE